MARIVVRAGDDDADAPVLDVALSVRNVLTLLGKAFTPGSAGAFWSGDVPKPFAAALIRIEPDELHYASPTREGAPPGPMHPFSELLLIRIREVVEELVAASSPEPPVIGPLLWPDPEPEPESQ